MKSQHRHYLLRGLPRCSEADHMANDITGQYRHDEIIPLHVDVHMKSLWEHGVFSEGFTCILP